MTGPSLDAARPSQVFEPLKWPEREDWRGNSGLYFVQAETGQIKIGRTYDMRSRLAALQSYSPVPLHLIGWVRFVGKRLERRIHQALSAAHLHSEWFAPTAEVCALVQLARTVDEDGFAAHAEGLPVVAQERRCRRGHLVGNEDRACRECAVVRQQQYAVRKADRIRSGAAQ